jgi:OOP family OmpA-OmpF porin
VAETPEPPAAAPSGGPVVLSTHTDLVMLEPVRFAEGAATIASGAPTLDEIAKTLAANPAIARVAVDGHADGAEKDPQALSLARAQAVVAELVKKGVDPKRLEARGLGAAKPMHPNDTAEGRAKNRRVEFVIQR